MFIVFGWGTSVGYAEAYEEKAEKKKTEEKDSIENSLKFVQIARVENQHYLVDVSSLGRVSSSQSISISAEVQGILRAGAVSLKKGVSFRRGQVLFKVSSSDAALLLKARKSGYLTLIATTLPDLKIDYPDHYEVWKLFFDNIEMDRPILPCRQFLILN